MLTDIHKKDGDILAIAMGNVFRRIASKFVIQSVSTRVWEQLCSVQVGFHIANGAEAAGYATQRRIMDACSHDII